MPPGCACTTHSSGCQSGDQNVTDRCSCAAWIDDAAPFCYVVAPDACPTAIASSFYSMLTAYRDCDPVIESPTSALLLRPAWPPYPQPPPVPPMPHEGHCRYVCGALPLMLPSASAGPPEAPPAMHFSPPPLPPSSPRSDDERAASSLSPPTPSAAPRAPPRMPPITAITSNNTAATVGAAGMAWWPLVVVAFLLVCLLAWLRDLASRTTGANRKQHHAAPTCDQQPLAATPTRVVRFNGDEGRSGSGGPRWQCAASQGTEQKCASRVDGSDAVHAAPRSVARCPVAGPAHPIRMSSIGLSGIDRSANSERRKRPSAEGMSMLAEESRTPAKDAAEVQLDLVPGRAPILENIVERFLPSV